MNRCCSCGSGVLSPRPTEARLSDYYPDRYAPYGHLGSVAQGALLYRALVRALSVLPALLMDPSRPLWGELRRRPRPNPRVLDVGCGDGRLLELDQHEGWEAVGVDTSHIAVARARDKGIDARQGTLHDVRLPPASFDLVRLSHVLEHVPDPRMVLQSAHRLLRPGGLAHVATPNFASPSARLFGRYWLGLDAPRHLVLFTPVSLRRLALQVGFAVEREVHEVAPSDFWASLQYWLEAFFRRATRTSPPALKRNVALRYLLYPLWWLLARMQKGERMHFVLRRPG